MLPKERVQIALEGGKPDRVPFLFECDSDYMTRAVGREPWEFIHAGSLEQAQIHEAFYQRHPSDLWKCWGGPSRSKLNRRQIIRSQKGVFYVDTHTGQRFRIDRRGDLLDEKGQPIGAGQTWLALKAFPRPVETEDDILEFLGPTPPPEFWIEDGFLSNLEYLLPRYGQSHFLMFPLNTIFADALDLFGGFEEGLIALSTKRELFHKALEAIVEWKISRLRAGAILHAPGAWMIEYTAGADTISPRAYREFVFPYQQKVIQEAHRLGMLVYLWYLGHVTPLAADIGRLGVDALFPEQGRKGYPVDIVELRRILGDRTCLIGFNNEQDLIQGNRQALSHEIERQIQGAGRNGAFIMGTTIVTEETAPETIDFYIEEVQRLGLYTTE